MLGVFCLSCIQINLQGKVVTQYTIPDVGWYANLSCRVSDACIKKNTGDLKDHEVYTLHILTRTF